MFEREKIIGMEFVAVAAGEYGLAEKEAELYLREKMEERHEKQLHQIS